MRIRVVLADRRRIVREGLRSLLARRADIEVVGEAADAETTLATARKLRPDVVILESALGDPDGVAGTRRIRAEFPEVKVIVLSDQLGCRTAVDTLGAGASAFLTGQSGFEELLQAVGSAIEARPSAGFVEPPDAGSAEPPRQQPKPLTVREVEVLRLLASGKRVKEIARDLCISAKTVESHRQNMMDKLEIHSAIELARYALREGLVSI